MKNYTFDSNDILAALQSGASADAIAKSFTDALNAAVKENREKSNKAEKVKRMEAILKMGADYVKDFYPDMVSDEMNLDAETIVEVIDDAYKETKQLAVKLEKIKTSDDPIGTFLKSYGLL